MNCQFSFYINKFATHLHSIKHYHFHSEIKQNTEKYKNKLSTSLNFILRIQYNRRKWEILYWVWLISVETIFLVIILEQDFFRILRWWSILGKQILKMKTFASAFLFLLPLYCIEMLQQCPDTEVVNSNLIQFDVNLWSMVCGFYLSYLNVYNSIFRSFRII